MNQPKPKTDMTFQILARFGYSSRGVIYLIVGALAFLAAVNMGGETTDVKGAVMTLGRQPFGAVVLALLSLGFVCYGTWRATQVIFDMDGHGTSLKGLAVRGGLAVSAITHLLLAYWTAKLLIGAVGSKKGEEFKSLSLLDNDWAVYAFIIIGLAIVGAGIAHLIKAWTCKFKKYMDIPQTGKKIICWISQFGLAARGVVWCLVGFFILRSVILTKRGELSGMEEALNSVASSNFGTILLMVISTGLFAFGTYSILEAFYRRVENPLKQNNGSGW